MLYSQKACSTTPVQTATWKSSPPRPPSASAAKATLTCSRILSLNIRPTVLPAAKIDSPRVFFRLFPKFPANLFLVAQRWIQMPANVRRFFQAEELIVSPRQLDIAQDRFEHETRASFGGWCG